MNQIVKIHALNTRIEDHVEKNIGLFFYDSKECNSQFAIREQTTHSASQNTKT